MPLHRRRGAVQLHTVRTHRRRRRRRRLAGHFAFYLATFAWAMSVYLAYIVGETRGTLETQDKYRLLEMQHANTRMHLRAAYQLLHKWYPYQRQSHLDRFWNRQRTSRYTDSVFMYGDSLGPRDSLQKAVKAADSSSGNSAVENIGNQKTR